MPTLAELTGGRMESTDGISLLPTLLNQSEQQRKHMFLYFEYPENGGWVSVRMGNWKAIRKQVKKNPNTPWELYDLTVDINESNNIADQHPDIIKKIEMLVRREHQHSHLVDWEFLF
jgi:arylsulfatase A-like enzyme